MKFAMGQMNQKPIFISFWAIHPMFFLALNSIVEKGISVLNIQNGGNIMKSLFLLAIVSIFSLAANAKSNCTDQPKEKWMTEEAFKKMVGDQGYKIRKFKQPGTCYEIYGQDKDGKNVEIYFNPVDGKIVKSK